MSRSKSDGLRWFPLDVSFFEDKQIRRLRGRFGSDGVLLYLYILCKAYENSFYVRCDEDFVADAALDLGCTPKKIGLMVDYLCTQSLLLDGKLMAMVKALSSRGIQRQYQNSVKSLKRAVEVEEEIWLLEKNETESFIQVRPKKETSRKKADKSRKNDDKSGKKALNKIKLNNMCSSSCSNKLVDICSDHGQNNNDNNCSIVPSLEAVEGYFRNQHLAGDWEAFYRYNRDRGWKLPAWAKNWQELAERWAERERKNKPETATETSYDLEEFERTLYGKEEKRNVDG